MTLLASLRDWLKAQQLDAVLLSSRQNKQPHLGISTGSGYVVISRESAHILVDSRYYADVEARTQGYQLHLLDAMHTLATIVRQIIADEQLQTLGFEGQQVRVEFYSGCTSLRRKVMSLICLRDQHRWTSLTTSTVMSDTAASGQKLAGALCRSPTSCRWATRLKLSPRNSRTPAVTG